MMWSSYKFYFVPNWIQKFASNWTEIVTQTENWNYGHDYDTDDYENDELGLAMTKMMWNDSSLVCLNMFKKPHDV